MSALGSLVVKLALEYAQYTGGLDKSEQATLASLKRIQSAADQFGDRVSDGLKNGLGGLAAFFTAGAIVNQVKSVVDQLDRIGDAASAVGVTTQAMAELGFAANQSGTDALTLEGAMGKLNLKISEGVGGNKEAVKLFAALGVQLTDTDGKVRSTDSVLAELADTFAALPEGPQKSALAVELFGKSGAGLLQFLSRGSKGIQELRAEFVALSGGPIDGAADQAGAFNDQLDKLSVMGQAATMRFGGELVPTLVEVAEMFTATGEDALGLGDGMSVASTAGAGLRTLLEFVLLVGSDVAFVLHGIGNEIGGIAAQAVAAAKFDFASVRNIRTEMVEDAERARKKLDDFQNRVMNPGQAAAPAGPTTGDVSRQDRERASSAAAAALRTEDTAAKAAADSYEKLMQSVRARMALADQQLALGRDLTEGEKFQAKAKEDLAKIASSLSSGQAAAAEAEVSAVKARIEQAEIEKAIAKEMLTLAQERQRVRASEADGIAAWFAAQEQASTATLQSIKDRLSGLRDEEEAVKLSRTANISLAEAVEELAIARLKEKQAGLREGSEEYERVEREIAARRELAGVLNQQDVRQREAQGWTDMWASVDRTAHDVFTNIFEGGSNVFKRLGQTLKASVLDVLYQMTVRRWIISIGTSLFGAGFGVAASAATGGAGGGVGNVLSGASLLGRLGGTFGMGLNAGFGGLVGEAGLMGALDAGGIALGAGNIMGGLGTIVGALGPIALGIGALVSLLGKDDSGTPHRGALAEYSAGSGLRTSQEHGAFGMGFGGVDSDEETRKAVGAVAEGMVETLDGVADRFGREARFTVATAFADDSSKDGAWGGLRIALGDNELVNWNRDRDGRWAPREYADGDEGMEQYKADLALGLRDALAEVVPEWGDTYLDALGDSPTLEGVEQAAASIVQLQAAWSDLGRVVPFIADMSEQAVSALAEAAGGMEQLTAGMASFQANYYADAERRAAMAAKISEELAAVDIVMPRTREEFRAMMEAALAMGDAGAEVVAALLSVEDEFASITPKVMTLADAFAISGDMIKGILDDAIENASSAEEASRMASEAFVDGMYASINDAMTSNLSGLIMGAIQPMVDAMIAGATTSGAAMAAGGAAGGGAVAAGGAAGGGAVAAGGAAGGSAVAAGGAVGGAIVAGVIEQARASIAVWTAVLSDPEVQGMIGTIGDMVGGVAAVAYEAGGSWSGSGGGDFVSPGSFGGPAGGAADLEDALTSLGKTLEDEVKRLRGLLVEDSPLSRDVLMAQFTTATAQARAGDKTALEKLPDISRALESATEETATSAVELARMRGWLAGSLTETLSVLGLDVPKFDVGTNYVPRDMLAMIHEGEAIVPKAFNPAAGGLSPASFAPAGGGTSAYAVADLAGEMREVRREIVALREQDYANTLAVQRLNLRSAKTLERVENILAMQ